MVKFRSCALALSCLALLAADASGQQRQGYRTRQVQQPGRQPAQTQYAQPQYRQPAQQPATDRAYGSATDEPGRPRANTADRKIALLMANCNKAEVKLARYALNRAESSEVRSFADSLQQDHDITLRQLRRFAPEIAGSDSADITRGYEPEQRRSSDTRPARAWDDATVAQQISERLVRKARDELSEKDGWEFDHTFVGQQLVAHQQDIAKLEVYRQYASPELRQVIDESIQIAEGHEQEARELANELRRGSSRGQREEYAGSRSERRRERYSRDETDYDDEGRVERASYEERRRGSRDDDDRRYRDRGRDDAEDDDSEEMEDDSDDDRSRATIERDEGEDADDDEEDDDDDRRRSDRDDREDRGDDRSDDDSRSRDR
jgi:predicted outer membrane protein